MKENSREEDIIKKFEKFCENLYVFKDDDMGGHFEKIVGNQRANTTLGYLVFKENLEEKLSDYKRLQKENEEWREAYQEEKDKQFELIQNTNNTIKTANIAIKDLQEKLKKVIPVQKVKDKIEEYKKMLISCNRFSDVDRIKAINERILELQELIESEEK